MPEPLANALPTPDRNDNTPANAGVTETPPAPGIPTPQTPAPTPPAPTISAETQQVLDTLKAVQEQVTGLAERVDAIPVPEPEPPAPETKPKWQPNSWDDFSTLAEQKGKEAAQALLDEREQAVEDAKAAQAAEAGDIDKEIDTKVSALETAGKIPPVKNAQDPNDPGRQFRRELYGLAAKLETLNLDEVVSQITTMNSQGIHYDFKANKWLRTSPTNPGQNTPVGSSSAAGAGSEEGPSYETIHKARSLSELARRAGM